MPAKNVIKIYIPGGYYHVYNRGVDKRNIFKDEQDYCVFLHFLKVYLSPNLKYKKGEVMLESEKLTGIIPVKERPIQSLCEEVRLLAFCLMGNHFHLMLQQLTSDGMEKLLRRVCITYAMYFNEKYQRTGRLFQGTYKAAAIDKDAYFTHLSRYIHQNPLSLEQYTKRNLSEYPYSSYPYFLNLKHADWVYPVPILECFSRIQSTLSRQVNSYKAFVEEYEYNGSELLSDLIFD